MLGSLQYLASEAGYEAVLIHTKKHLGVLALFFLDHFTLELRQAIFAVIVSIASVHSLRHLLP